MRKPVHYKNKRQFFWRNFLKGFGVLVLLIAAFIFFKKDVDPKYITWLEPVYSNPALVFLIFIFSEIVFGLIPPEVFMFWAVEQGGAITYIHIIFWFTVITYGAGWLAYFLGRRGSHTRWYRYLNRKYLGKYMESFQEYGGFLIIVAALTPVPYSGVCMLVGAAGFRAKDFFLYSLSRIGRFIVYSAVVWEANTI